MNTFIDSPDIPGCDLLHNCYILKKVYFLTNPFVQFFSTDHHKRFEYCKTRPKYRSGRQQTAVKVKKDNLFLLFKKINYIFPQSYTIANESIHLLVFGVPKINLQNEVKKTFQRFGKTDFVTKITEEVSKERKFFFQKCLNMICFIEFSSFIILNIEFDI